jgi:DNA-directed RNA polymerase specialized sigma24 family protein
MSVLTRLRSETKEKQMMEQGLQESPDNLDQDLQQLAIAAQQQPPSERRIALNRLVQGILKSNHLGHPQRGQWAATIYEDIYHEALQKTLLEICQKIDRYNPEHPVMAWVNFYLNNHFIGVVKDYQRSGLTYVPRANQVYTNCLPSWDDLDRYVPVEEAMTDEQHLRQFLEEDPENLLKAERLRERSDVTFQYLALAKFVEDRTWADIADNLGISIQTLCSFFNRRLQKLMPYFHKYLQE